MNETCLAIWKMNKTRKYHGKLDKHQLSLLSVELITRDHLCRKFQFKSVPKKIHSNAAKKWNWPQNRNSRGNGQMIVAKKNAMKKIIFTYCQTADSSLRTSFLWPMHCFFIAEPEALIFKIAFGLRSSLNALIWNIFHTIFHDTLWCFQ